MKLKSEVPVRALSATFVTFVGLSVVGCSGSDPGAGLLATGSPGLSGSGGAIASNGGAATVGGNVANGGNSASKGGAPSNGGSNALGGTTSATGGSNATQGGNATTGGATSTSGGTTQATGGKSAGGATSAGGTSSNGGSNVGGTTTKGGTTSSGGSPAAGGAATGGKAATGGTSAAGGTTATGGAATGGTSATGGTTATGGAATGGKAATGGTTAAGGTTATCGSGIPSTCTEANLTLSGNGTGKHCNYTYEYWKDSGTGSLILKPDGFSVSWSGINNLLGRKGIRPGSASQIVTYDANYQPNGNSYLCIYGWTTSPLIEYYIVDSWGTWRPPGGTSVGTVTSDGGTYDIYQTQRVNQPSIQGTTTFYQYWSVRTAKRTCGTITVANHFSAWAAKGMNIGSLYEVSMTVEGYQSSGTADVSMSMQ